MRKIYSILIAVGLSVVFGLWTLPAQAADIQAVLDEAAGGSAFAVQDSTPTTMATIDSDGNAVFKGGVRIDSGGAENTAAETLEVDGNITVGKGQDAAATNITLTFGGTNPETITFNGAGDDWFDFSDDIAFGWGSSIKEVVGVEGNLFIAHEGIQVGAAAANNQIDDASGGSGSTVLYIGTNTINTTAPSDRRLKTDIKDTSLSLDDLLKIRVRDFRWKKGYFDNGKHIQRGMVAQELVKTLPEVVRVPKDPDGTRRVEYNKLIPLLVKSIQDLDKKVEKLEKQNKKLEASLKNYKQ